MTSTADSPKTPLPVVKLKAASPSPNLYRRMVDDEGTARSGDIVAVQDKSGAPYGIALYNKKSQIALRLISREHPENFSEETFFASRLERAVNFRRETLKIPQTSDAYRLVHDYGDGLPGLVADLYGDFIVLEFYSLAMYRRAVKIEAALKKFFPQAKFVHRASQYTETMEGFELPKKFGAKADHRLRVSENGVQFEVRPEAGYKTGFFCDQRENRLYFSKFAAGKRTLDICAYTGGFGLYARKLGGAGDTTCVELDADACEVMKKNANINNTRLNIVCADAFPYLRQMHDNGTRYGLVVLDPYKLVAGRDFKEKGLHKYRDFNRLALGVVEEGGVLLTCSCSGLVSMHEFEQILRTAAGGAGRKVQIFKKSAAAPDHPVMADYPEGEYLKAIWCRVY
ncbi:MAG TPA: class I SAM-dependent rRNA methyltransferase [Elusimicrobiales bacterium]|nr:class I SAM-dependent rRNA methyltransferase [Elusimicrobiales bacterium]